VAASGETSYGYGVAITGPKASSFDIWVSPETLGKTTVVETSVTVPGNPEIRTVESYRADTRESKNTPGFYGWFWATVDDAHSPAATFGFLNYANAGESPEGRIFVYDDGKGIVSELLFSSQDLLLTRATAAITLSGETWHVEVISKSRPDRVVSQGSAMGSLITPIAQGPAPLALVHSFRPPYSQSGGYPYTFREGTASAAAYFGHAYSTGYLYDQAEVAAGIPYGRARADAFSYIAGPPSMSFNLGTSRNYQFQFRLSLTGRAETSRTLCTFLGCMTAQSKITFTGRVYAVGGSVATQKECLLYEGSALPLPKYREWSSTIVYCSWTAYMYAGNYWFQGEFFTSHIASNVLVGLATASSRLTVYMTNVYVYTA
jgi:hypothetical protein